MIPPTKYICTHCNYIFWSKDTDAIIIHAIRHMTCPYCGRGLKPID